MLTSLELFGFKSFADRTLFEFSPGITCVVGPNGSGKSNVVDAIKWILGDQSPKSLRGKEMADVIFNGSSGRKPSGFAEATLAFDNSAGLLPLPDSEVRVGRRLYRSGDSEYLLNGAVVRLKDVRELFLGTGAGTSAYSIIEQGRVDQILQANPTTRRVVFEEAAGILRYKSRRVDAERKLEKVAQNLLRLTDIVDEVETQLTAARSQASKAARFRELSQELKTLWTGLAADDYRLLSRDLARLEAAQHQHAAALEQLSGRIAAAEAGRADVDARLAALEVELRREERQAAAVREQLAAHESTIRHQTAREAELTAEIDRLRADRMALVAQATAIARELEETSARLGEFEQRVARQRQALESRSQQCEQLAADAQALEAQAEERRRQRQSADQELAAHERRLTRLHSQQELLERNLRELRTQQDQLERAAAAAELELQTRQAAAAAADAQWQAAQQEADEARAHRKQLREAQAALEQSLAAARERRSAAVARIHVLEDLERRQEGISLGVREILRRAHDSPHPPWNEILGSVSDLVQVSLEQAPLVEVALGGRSQLVVVKRLQPIVEYLHRQPAPLAGRVGFLELAPRDISQHRVAAEPDLAGQPGVVCRADELLEEITEAAGLAAQLLADTWIVNSLHTALRLRTDHPRLRFVTEQGELLDADGTVYAGTIPNTTALVSRRSELRDLKHEVIRLDRELERGGERAEQLALELDAADRRLAEAEGQVRRRLELAADARAAVDGQLREVEHLAAEWTRLEDQLHSHAAERSRLAAALEEAQQERQRLEAQRQRLDRETAELQAQHAQASADVASLRNELKEHQLELAKHEERLAGLRDVLNRLTAEQQQRRQRREQADQRLADAVQTRRQTRLTILRTRSQLDLGVLTLEEHGRKVARLSAELREHRQHSAALSREEEQLHRQRRRLLDEQHQTDIRLREVRGGLAALDERIVEEFQRPVAEFAAEGASAFRAWLQAHHPEFAPPTAAGDVAAMYDSAPVPFAELRPELEEQVQRVRRKLKLLGSVNTDALQELDELETRFASLSAQRQDLQAAKEALEEIIRRLNKESRRLFLETFESIRQNFRELFRKVFGGGEGDIILEDPDNVLECGIEIVARPPGKELRSITLLSGGEKTMTAVALLLAMFKCKPSPYCILDEVDAALDDANVDRYVSIVREFAAQTQFVIITHRKRTMTAADVLYGVTMEQAGVSKRMSVRFEDVSEDGHIRARSAA